MITNERQYRIAKAELRRFAEAVEVRETQEPSRTFTRGSKVRYASR